MPRTATAPRGVMDWWELALRYGEEAQDEASAPSASAASASASASAASAGASQSPARQRGQWSPFESQFSPWAGADDSTETEDTDDQASTETADIESPVLLTHTRSDGDGIEVEAQWNRQGWHPDNPWVRASPRAVTTRTSEKLKKRRRERPPAKAVEDAPGQSCLERDGRFAGCITYRNCFYLAGICFVALTGLLIGAVVLNNRSPTAAGAGKGADKYKGWTAAEVLFGQGIEDGNIYNSDWADDDAFAPGYADDDEYIRESGTDQGEDEEVVSEIYIEPVHVPSKRPTGNWQLPGTTNYDHSSYVVPREYSTEYDGAILVPERRRDTLYLMPGGEESSSRNWTLDASVWSMVLYPAELWKNWNSINDVKRVVHQNRNHIAVCGNGGNAIALYDFETKAAAYWSRTCGRGPHDVEYIPLRGGYLALASSMGKDSTIELHDVNMPNDSKCIRGSSIEHPGVHAVHWDAKQHRLWAWGSDTRGLVEYKVEFSDKSDQPRLVKMASYNPDVRNFKVGTGHGASPMVKDGSRYLILAAHDGVLRFDTESHKWKVLKSSKDADGPFSNPKGVDYNQETGEIIFTKSFSRVFSADKKQERQFAEGDADIYKARWWQHNSFSFDPDRSHFELPASLPAPASAPAPAPAPVHSIPTISTVSEASIKEKNPLMVGVYYFLRNTQRGRFSNGEQYLRNQLLPPQEPELGEYVDTDPSVIAKHLSWTRSANINLWITSWRGPNSNEDITTKNIIMRHEDLSGTKIALNYETHTRIDFLGDSSEASYTAYNDVSYIAQTYFDDPNYLRIDEKPVLHLFVSRILYKNDLLEGVIEAMRNAAFENGHEIYIIGDHAFGEAPTRGLYYRPFELLDAVTSYDVYGEIAGSGYAELTGVQDFYNTQKKWLDRTNHSEESCNFIPSVTPGFNDGPRHTPLSRKRDATSDPGSLFKALLKNAVRLSNTDEANSNMILINSWNGFHDDTQIEPLQQAPVTQQALDSFNQMGLEYEGYGELYLDITRKYISP